MAKRITFSLIVLLIASALVFVSCSQEAAEGGKKIPPKPAQDEPVENVAGNEGANIIVNIGFDVDSDIEFNDDSGASTFAIVAGAGISGSKAMSVVQNTNYAGVIYDLTENYGRGKSYYIEASFKNNDSPVTEDLTARISYSVVSGAVYDAPEPYYDAEIVYSGEFLDSGEAEDIFEIEVNDEGESIEGGEWVTVCGIIPATEIDRIVGNSTLKYLQVSFYVGTYSEDESAGQKGYTYFLDDVIIKDLNTELETTGATYEAPEEEAEAE